MNEREMVYFDNIRAFLSIIFIVKIPLDRLQFGYFQTNRFL